jgi:hypothetical protein
MQWYYQAVASLVGVRLQANLIKAIDAWAAKQQPAVTRPEAIRGMIDEMLHILAKDPGEKPAEKAKIPRSRLTPGAPEFREDRVDRPKAKGR